eukprot:8604440-Pyramimonas_sp.AAC.1
MRHIPTEGLGLVGACGTATPVLTSPKAATCVRGGQVQALKTTDHIGSGTRGGKRRQRRRGMTPLLTHQPNTSLFARATGDVASLLANDCI